jgi:hypothetical protein
MTPWFAVSLAGGFAALGGYGAGYWWAGRSVPEGCTFSSFDEGIFNYLCEQPGGSVIVRSVGFDVTAVALLVGGAIGFAAWQLLKRYIGE